MVALLDDRRRNIIDTSCDPRPLAMYTALRLDVSFATQSKAPPSMSGISVPSLERAAI